MQCHDLVCAFGIGFFCWFYLGFGDFFQIKVNIVRYNRDCTSAFIFKCSSEFILKVTIYIFELDFWSQRHRYSILKKVFIKVGRNELHWQLRTYVLTFSGEKYRIVFQCRICACGRIKQILVFCCWRSCHTFWLVLVLIFWWCQFLL